MNPNDAHPNPLRPVVPAKQVDRSKLIEAEAELIESVAKGDGVPSGDALAAVRSAAESVNEKNPEAVIERALNAGLRRWMAQQNNLRNDAVKTPDAKTGVAPAATPWIKPLRDDDNTAPKGQGSQQAVTSDAKREALLRVFDASAQKSVDLDKLSQQYMLRKDLGEARHHKRLAEGYAQHVQAVLTVLSEDTRAQSAA
jgi:hypothetical protein